MKVIWAAIIALAVAVPLFAHMKILKTEPADGSTVTSSPKQVQVWFDETPDIKVTKMTLTGPGGAAKLGVPKLADKSIQAPVPGSLAGGAYTVDWTSAGDDGHVQKGQFKFTVKAIR
jgi:methionine-rich copper-binding protein CopC